MKQEKLKLETVTDTFSVAMLQIDNLIENVSDTITLKEVDKKVKAYSIKNLMRDFDETAIQRGQHKYFKIVC